MNTHILYPTYAITVDTTTEHFMTLDLDDFCGFAYGGTGHVLTGCWDLVRQRRRDNKSAAQRLMVGLDALNKIANDTAIYYIAPRHSSAKQLERVLLAWAELNDRTCRPVNPGVVRKQYTGNGSASGKAMIDESDRRGFFACNEREAGAIALFDLVISLVPEKDGYRRPIVP